MFKQCVISSVISEESNQQECGCCQKKKPRIRQDQLVEQESDNMKLSQQKDDEQTQIEQLEISLDNINILIKMIIKQQYDDLYFRHKNYTNLQAQKKYKNNHQLFLNARDLILKFESDVSKLINPLEQQFNQQQQVEIDFQSDKEDETGNIDYQQEQVIDCFEEVSTTVLSEDLRLLAISSKKNCSLWDFENRYEIFKYQNDNIITALCLQPNDKLIIGDQIGYINVITFNQNFQKLAVWEYNLHKEEIYYLIEKGDQQFYSYSKNNKLILFNQILKSIVFQIDVSIMGQGNFDFCPKNQYLIAPNLLGLTIWNGQDGQEITTSSQLYSADNVVQICYESNTNQILLSLQKQKRLLVLSYDTEKIQFFLKRIFNIYGVVTNISWLEDGQFFSIFFSDQLQVRSTKCHKLPLRFRYKTNSKTTFFDKQNHSGKYLISIEDKHVYVYVKQSIK